MPTNRPRCLDSGHVVRAGHVAGREDQAGDDRQARRPDRPGRRPGRRRCSACRRLFYGPYFCAEQETKWYDLTERIPDGPTTKLMQELAKKHKMVMVVPMYEEDLPGVYYNAAAVIDADGRVPRQVPQDPHPALQPGLLGKVLLPARQPRLPGVRHQGRQGRRLHLLRPPLPRGRPLPGAGRRGDRVQPVGHGRGPERVPVEARATGPRRGEPVLRRRDQSPRLGRALADRRVLRPELLLSTPAASSSPRATSGPRTTS